MDVEAKMQQEIVDFVGDRQVEFGDLYEWAEHALPEFAASASAAGLTIDEYLEDLIEREPRIYDTGDGYIRLDLLLDSLVFTHRLTAEEIDRSIMYTHPDLAVVDWDGTEQFSTPEGGTITNPVRDRAFDGPGGWLAGFEEGDVVSIRRVDGVMTVEGAPDGLSRKPASALREAFDLALANTMNPVQPLAEVVLSAADAFGEPVAPLSDLIAEAGLDTQGDLIALVGTDFGEGGPAITDQRLAATAERWAMEECCTQRLRSLLDLSASGTIDDPRRIVDDMGHEAVVLGLRDMLQGSEVLESDDIREWLDGIVDAVGRRAAPALTLRAFHHELNGDPVEAEADLEGAHSFDPEFAPASVELAMYLTMRSEFKRAVSVLNAIGSDGSAIADLFSGIHMDASDVGRNDPCPCGSGRKYKACHLGKPITTPAAMVDTLLLKLRMFVTDLWRGAAGLPVLAMVASDGDPHGIGEMYNDDFLQSVAVFEGDGIVDFLERMGALLPPEELLMGNDWVGRSLRLYEVKSKGPGEQVTVVDLLDDVELVLDDRELADRGEIGSIILTWLVPAGSGQRIAPPVLTVGTDDLDEIRDLIENRAVATDWAAWYGRGIESDGD